MIDIVLDSFNSLIRSIQIFLTTKDLTVGAILAGLSPFIVIWIKLNREKEKKARSALIERRQMQIAFNVNEIMEALKVESKWSLQEIGSTTTGPQNSKKLFSSLRRVMKLGSLRRNKRMNFLKSNLSKKLTMVIVTTLLIALNEKLSLGMSQETIFTLAGMVAAYVVGQSAVDAKKELKANEPTPTISTSEFEG